MQREQSGRPRPRGSTTEPTRWTVNNLTERLAGATREALSCFREAPPFDVAEADQNKFKVVYPLSAHVMELVAATNLLVEEGFSYAAEPCARAALQHAVTAQWIVLTHDGEREVVAEMKRVHKATVQDFSASVELPEELLAHAASLVSHQGPARDFWRMCERFSTDKSLYVMFRRLSDAVHPSLKTMNAHLDADDERGVFGIIPRSPTTPDPDVLLCMAVSALLALSAVESLRNLQRRMQEVHAIADRWQVPVDLRGDDQDPGLAHAPS
jgi:hypothetical protein